MFLSHPTMVESVTVVLCDLRRVTEILEDAWVGLEPRLHLRPYLLFFDVAFGSYGVGSYLSGFLTEIHVRGLEAVDLFDSSIFQDPYCARDH